jgi:hypothetical protein
MPSAVGAAGRVVAPLALCCTSHVTPPDGSRRLNRRRVVYECSTLENVWSAPEVPFEPDWFWRLRLLLFGFAERLSEIR